MLWYLNLLPDYKLLGIPIRILSVLSFLTPIKVKRNTLILPLFSVFYLITYGVVSVFFDRSFTVSDLGVSATLIIFFIYFNYSLSNPGKFIYFARVFFILNVFYILYQVVVIYLGLPSLSLIHQNSHAEYYVIPTSNYPPYLPRFTGLFVESAPLSIYLAFSFLLFRATGLKFDNVLAILSLLLMFLGGAKSSYAFFLLFIAYYFKFFRYTSVLFVFVCMILTVALLFNSNESVISFLSELDSESLALGSIIVRLSWFFSTIDMFLIDPIVTLFGSGFVTTNDLLSGDGFQRGIDFFSYFIFSVGIVGFFVFLITICVIFNRKSLAYISKSEFRLSVLVLMFSLMVMGSIFNFQYVYFFCSLLVINKLRESNCI